MQVKCFFLTLIVLFSFLPLGFAQDSRPIVQLIYFRPSDIPPSPDVDAEINAMIKKAQRFFADEMERHGYGRKTFQFEADVNRNVVVHHVNGKFPIADYENSNHAWVQEIREQINIPNESIPVYMIERGQERITVGRGCGEGSRSGVHIYCWAWGAVAHELGHAFDLPHDHRSSAYIMSYGLGSKDSLSQCHAEWLDVHPLFNDGQAAMNEPTTVKMLSSSLAALPNTIRFRFEVTDPDGLHQAQLSSTYTVTSLLSCKSLSGESSIVEFITTGLTLEDKGVWLQIIDVHGNIKYESYSIDIADLLPPPEVVLIPDADLAAAVRKWLRLAPDDALTTHTMLNLRTLVAQDLGITNLTGLEHAHALETLYLDGNPGLNPPTLKSALTGLTQLRRLEFKKSKISDISWLSGLTQLDALDLLWNSISDMLARNPISDISALAGLIQLTDLEFDSNSISDISALAGLTRLTRLRLARNPISDISALAGLIQLTDLEFDSNSISDISALAGLTRLERLDLTDNDISDVSPLLALNLIGTSWDPTGLYLEGNPLSYASINMHIPALQAKGIEVTFDNVAHPALLKISGDGQEGAAGALLASPFVVEAQDESGRPMRNVPVTFAIDTGDGILSTTTTITDANGRAQTTLTLNWTPGTSTVSATAAGIRIQSSVIFTATATVLPDRLAEDVNGDGEVSVEDLLLVAASFGTAPAPGVMPNTDVNGDGVVNNEDMLLVLAALEAAPAAPALDTQWTAVSLQRWIAEAKQRNSVDVAWLKGISVLEQWLSDLLPKETVLLHNYPNPFNPETWIPYQLAVPAEVTLTIYAVNGQVVRTLALGHQIVGIYHSRSRAAYWDGRNEQGERVASGVYFYTLSAGNFTATRKMLIQK
jgi:Leucine-rich repeat (LRR) protein